MDLSNPLAVLTPTLDAAVLQALAATTGWASGAHVHRLSGTGSDDGVRRVLARLVDQGIVLADQHSHATLYLLNRDHVAADAIVRLTRLRGVIIDRIKGALERWSPAPVHAALFGSFARGEATAHSDIDLLVVTEPGANPDVTAAAVDQLAVDIRKWTGNNAHIVDRNLEELAAMITADDPLVASWRADHLDLMGTRLLDLLRHARGPREPTYRQDH
jgi:predicted nucleotidyltransferase